MDTQVKPFSFPVAGVPITFAPEELSECFGPHGRFRKEKLRQKQAEKVLQVILRHTHGIVVSHSKDVHKYAELKRFQIARRRGAHWGYHLMTLSYELGGRHLKETFRFLRDSGKESTNGYLCLHPGTFRPAR